MGLTLQKKNFVSTGRKKVLLLGLIIWILGFLVSLLIMGILGIHPGKKAENWGINHPKYLQFELLMITTMIILMFVIALEFFKQQENSATPIDVLKDGFLIMIIQFMMDLIVLVVVMKVGIAYFYGLVTLMYVTIPFQWYIFARIGNSIKN